MTKTKECETCSGTGEIDCDECDYACEHSLECPDCDGTGEIEDG